MKVISRRNMFAEVHVWCEFGQHLLGGLDARASIYLTYEG